MATSPDSCVLTVDRGNTMVKAVVWEGDYPLTHIVGRHLPIEEIRDAVGHRQLLGAVFCSVGAPEPSLVEALQAMVADRLLVVTHDTPVPIGVDYKTPATLGLDRLAAACGCAAIYPAEPLLIVDAGTAVTLDLVDASNIFRGGNIAPGLFLRFKSLREHTSRLPMVSPEGDIPAFGYDTVTAIRSGVVEGLIAQIDFSYRRARTLHGVRRVLLGGGDASFLHPLLLQEDIPVEVVPDMVSRGLLEIFKFN